MRRFLKWTGIVFGGLVSLILLAAVAIYFVTESRLNKEYDVQVAAVAVPADSAAIARGRHLAMTRGCADCHGENFAGKSFIDAPPVGQLWAANLTAGKGGVGARYKTDADWDRAIRHGLRQDGKPLLFMPSQEFQFTDADYADLVAYLKTVPAVDNEMPVSTVGPIGRALYLSGMLPLVPAELIDHDAPAPTVVPAVTVEYGGYLAAGCKGCHGNTFSGGAIPGDPSGMVPANITQDEATGIGTWTEEDFVRALRTGKRPDGSTLNERMPWQVTARMTDTELRAMWAYFKTVPAKPEGNR